MGIGIARHLKRLERVIVGYLEVSDGPDEKARLGVLEVLEKTIQVAWPRYLHCYYLILMGAVRICVHKQNHTKKAILRYRQGFLRCQAL